MTMTMTMTMTTMTTGRLGPLLSVLLLACASACETPSDPALSPPPLIEATVEAGYPTLSAGCRGPVAEPTHLVVTSTDFNTGAVGLVELASREVSPDLASASSDAVPFVVDDRVFIVNRFGFDYIDELDPHAALALVHEFAITSSSGTGPTNPQALTLDAQDRGWVSLLGTGELQAIEFPTLTAAQPHASLAVDLSSFADADGIPELSAIIGCGSVLFVAAERVDRSQWVPADDTLLIPLALGTDDTPEPSLFDWDPEHPGGDAIHLLGDGIGTWRLDPSDPSGHTIVVLNSGLERVDLVTGTSAWIVDEQLFEAAGYARLQLSSFDFDADGRIWLSAATPDFASFSLIRVETSSPEPTLVIAVEQLQSVTGALEIVGHEAWFADTTLGSSGLRVWDLAADPVSESPESPLAVGLAPMSLAPLAL